MNIMLMIFVALWFISSFDFTNEQFWLRLQFLIIEWNLFLTKTNLNLAVTKVFTFLSHDRRKFLSNLNSLASCPFCIQSTYIPCTANVLTKTWSTNMRINQGSIWGLYYKHNTIVNDDACVISKQRSKSQRHLWS